MFGNAWIASHCVRSLHGDVASAIGKQDGTIRSVTVPSSGTACYVAKCCESEWWLLQVEQMILQAKKDSEQRVRSGYTLLWIFSHVLWMFSHVLSVLSESQWRELNQVPKPVKVNWVNWKSLSCCSRHELNVARTQLQQMEDLKFAIESSIWKPLSRASKSLKAFQDWSLLHSLLHCSQAHITELSQRLERCVRLNTSGRSRIRCIYSIFVTKINMFVTCSLHVWTDGETVSNVSFFIAVLEMNWNDILALNTRSARFTWPLCDGWPSFSEWRAEMHRVDSQLLNTNTSQMPDMLKEQGYSDAFRMYCIWFIKIFKID